MSDKVRPQIDIEPYMGETKHITKFDLS